MTDPETKSIAYDPLDPALLAHEMRTPLTAIAGFAETLSLAALGPLPEAYREHGAIIHHAALHLLALTDALGGSSTPLDHDLSMLADEIVALLGPSAASGDIALSLRGPAGPSFVRGYDRALRQILINLIDNGVKFTAPGGKVNIEILGDKDHVSVKIANSGGREAEGSRLGLPLVRALCAAHGGDLALEPRPGGGMVATVRLPRAAKA